MNRATTRCLVAGALLGLLASACGGPGDEPAERSARPTGSVQKFAEGTYMAEIQKRGTLRVGVKADIPQIGFLNPLTSQFEGFEIDIAKEIAERLGVKPEFQEAVSDNRIPFLSSDPAKVDLVLSTFTINDERRKQIDFSVVYYLAGQSLLVSKDSKIKDIKALADQKGKICTAKGSTSETNLKAAAPGAEVVLLRAYSECVQQLRNNQVEAVSTDDVILLQFIAKEPDRFKLTGGTFSREPYGVGIKKGRPEFLEFVNTVLRDIKEDGTWEEIYDRWIKKFSGKAATPPDDDARAAAPSAAPAATSSATPTPVATPPTETAAPSTPAPAPS
ncbi:MAG TPA: glutamate ABC transporter substrate-binding protein [Actinomycetota bacterium]|nr:glutamate ABC transporter substrate-binding protein [Actinomycetota bacterium]